MSDAEHTFSRRRFLAAAAAGAGGLAVGGPVAAAVRGSAAQRRPPIALDGAFRQSVSSGQPATDGITLWTRVEELDRTSRPRSRWHPTAGFARVLHRETVQAEAGRDYTVHHRISQSKALRPGEQYHYRFFTCNESSPRRPFPDRAAGRFARTVRIGFFSCQNYAAGYYAAHKGLLAEPDLDLVVCLGDYIYEQTGEDEIADRRDRTGVNRDSEVQTLPEYRDKYRLYHSDPDLLALRARYPLQVIWDDHESENDNAGSSPSPAGAAEHQVPPGALRRAARNGLPRVLRAHAPDRGARGREPDLRHGSTGRQRRSDLLDERQYRDRNPAAARRACRAHPRRRTRPGERFWAAHRRPG